MATSCLSPETIARIRSVYAETGSTIETARRLGINKSSVLKYRDVVPVALDNMTPRVQYDPRDVAFTVTMPEPAAEAGGATLPDPIHYDYTPFEIDTPGAWGVISDLHIPEHDKRTIELWEKKCRDSDGILINGDLMECASVSRHKNIKRYDIEEEIEKTQQFLAWLRSRFPRARIVFKEGNHDDMMPRYLADKCPELTSVKQLQLPILLDLAKYGVEWVADKRVIMLGKLPVLHGHEFRGGGGLKPAKWLYDRTRHSALCGHFHKTDKHTEKDIKSKLHITWTVGCARFLHPDWMPQNRWNHGFARVEVANDGRYHVDNYEVLRDGTVA